MSLALLPSHIEPVPIAPRVRNLKILSRSRVPCVLYFRPIVKGWNDSRAKIRRLLNLGERYCDAISIGGLRLSPEIASALEDARIAPPADLSPNFHVKELPDSLERRILAEYRNLRLTVPLFKHTSCAVSAILKMPNYNMLYRYPAKFCVSTCPPSQQRRCARGPS